jgi:hypothetical protein
MPQQRKPGAKALFPNHPSIEDPQRFVRGQVGSGVRQSWIDALKAARPEPQEAGSFMRQLLSPATAPRAFKKKGK